MTKASIRLLALLVVGLALAGCETTGTKEESEPAAVEERGSQVGPGATEGAAGDASTRAYAGTPGFTGHPLDDPGSPLSKRIVYFEFDSAEVGAEYRPVIEAHAAYLRDHPRSAVTLEGHADERGSREYNVALGERRSKAVERLMSLLGASDQQLVSFSYGEERPAALGHEESSWGLNRRVEIVYERR